jgi:hypothetical protein
MFYTTARQRNAEKEMSEATLRKMHRKVLFSDQTLPSYSAFSLAAHCLTRRLAPQAEILESEVKAKLAKAFAQLRHAVHHYAEVKRDVEQGLLDRENKLAERHQGGGEGGHRARAAAAFL